MKLAEALAERADAVRRIAQLRSRVTGNARYQEGEEPDEDAAALLVEAEQVLQQLETLIRRINRTNASARLEDGSTVTDALARRDVLRTHHSLLTAAADAAAGRDNGYGRRLRSELRMFAALPVSQLRGRADALARDIRELDVSIQRSNWEVDLVD